MEGNHRQNYGNLLPFSCIQYTYLGRVYGIFPSNFRRDPLIRRQRIVVYIICFGLGKRGHEGLGTQDFKTKIQKHKNKKTVFVLSRLGHRT
jgi:hypothetical protein